METSILTSTKKILGIAEDYTAFDHDIVTHINAVFGILSQLGIGPVEGFIVEDAEAEWSDFVVPSDELHILPSDQMNLVKTYVFLKVRMLFDPPGTSFLIEAMNNQISEYEWRLSHSREMTVAYREAPFWENEISEEVTW